MSTITVSADQVSSQLGEEAVILNVKTGVYYGLNEVGARIWSLIQEPVRFDAIVQTLLEEYDVEASQCEDDVRTLLQELMAAKLIEVGDGKSDS
jgi:hypothetical protein